MDQVKVQYVFTVTEGKTSYTDAIYYDLDTYSSITPQEKEAQKQVRFAAYKAELAKTPPPIDLDRAIADCQIQIDFYTQQKADYTAQKGGAK